VDGKAARRQKGVVVTANADPGCEVARHNLEHHRRRARELLRAARAAEPDAWARLAPHVPPRRRTQSAAGARLADAQRAIAREAGFATWAQLKDYGLFQRAVAAFDGGNGEELAALLDDRPSLVRYRCRHGEWYEAGYFAGATLLEHVAGNPDRGLLPGNVVELARLILARKPDKDVMERTLGLLLTSRRASEAGVALPLADLLAAAGAPFDPHAVDLLSLPLLNVAPATATALAARGATVDLRHAAGLGDVAAMEPLLAAAPALLEEALAFACIRGQTPAAEWLVRHGARGDVLVAPGSTTPRTALHDAANRGHRQIVELLLAAGADCTVVEPHWGGTAAGWAAAGGHGELAEILRHAETALRRSESQRST
jgi:hypothetical protein